MHPWLERLKQGDVDFVYELTYDDSVSLIAKIRLSPNRIEIINGFLSKLKKDNPIFCFLVIYDIQEFENEAYELFNIKNINPDILNNLLNNSTLGMKVLDEYLDIFFSCEDKEKYTDVILNYAFSSNSKLLHKLSRHPNLHVRYVFMKYLIDNYPKRIDDIYDDITRYTTSLTFEPHEQLTYLPDLMNQEDISELAVKLLIINRDDDYKKLKDYILKEYKSNNLAKELLDPIFIQDKNCPSIRRRDHDLMERKEDAFRENSDALFVTSSSYQFHMFFYQKYNIKQELIDEFINKMRYFLDENKIDRDVLKKSKWDLLRIDNCELTSLLGEWAEKYMDLSKSKEYGYIGEGSTCACYRIGDYVIKLVRGKWSYEDVICPNLYLIAKNYEEVYIRDKKGVVEGGLEVQKFLTRSAKDIDPKYLRYFDLALNRLGYKRTDTLTRGTCGDNVMLLDSYKDADCSNPEKVPVWFRQYPIVLVDRDRIYPRDKQFIKQLSSGY